MHKLTSFILAGLLTLCIAMPVQAETKDDASFMESLGGKGSEQMIIGGEYHG